MGKKRRIPGYRKEVDRELLERLEARKINILDNKETDIGNQILSLANLEKRDIRLVGMGLKERKKAIKFQEWRLERCKWVREHSLIEVIDRIEQLESLLCFKCYISIRGGLPVEMSYPCPKCKTLYSELVLLYNAIGVLGR